VTTPLTHEVTPTADRLARVALSVVWEPADAELAALVEADGAVQALTQLRHRLHRGVRRAAAIRNLEAIDPLEVLTMAAATGIRFVIPGDDEWPASLDVLAHVQREGSGGRPLGLWVRGEQYLRTVLTRSVSVVGSRAATAYGQHVAAELGAGLADRGVTVVSGAAYGIDAAAHRGALAAGGLTVAVLACGVDVTYPRGNAGLLARVAADGLIVSEAPPGATPNRPRFLVRNRIIAAATLGTVVVEAAARSGALNTARWAHDCDRALMGVPGPVTSSLSAGVHAELRQGATLVTDAAEVVDLIGEFGTDAADEARGPRRPWDGLPAMAAAVFEAMPVRGAVGLGELCTRTPAAPRECLAALGLLVSRGLVEPAGTEWRMTARVRQAVAETRRGGP
jgi:DNA processing protein